MSGDLRAQILAALQAKAVPLVPVKIDGLPTFYTRGLTVGQARAAIVAPKEERSLADIMREDPLFLDRRIAAIILDENGNPVFDAKDDAQMGELRKVMELVPPEVSGQITRAAQRENEPTEEQAQAGKN